ncbi:hypothetical protein WA026_015294 [Henosepilachna vigintioctopunctata]|uniref:Uncharacterized protein n=1 Tax=Henosepilachna vigintioctopunctata TaxID=420089 RepID=A0AAW1TMQ4_9CUCU
MPDNEETRNTPVYRSSVDCTTSNPTPNPQKSYSNVVSQKKYPDKDQAIIFSALERALLQDYTIALGSTIPPKNFTHLSKMTNNRICVYLQNKVMVNNFMENIGEITVNGIEIKARKLVTPAKRLVFSNVCPTVTDEIIINEIVKLGLTPISLMTSLRISTSLPEFNRILSFRQQIYIKPGNSDIPDSLDNNQKQNAITETAINTTEYIGDFEEPHTETIEDTTTTQSISTNQTLKRPIESTPSPLTTPENSNNSCPVFTKPIQYNIKAPKKKQKKNTTHTPPKTENSENLFLLVEKYINENSSSLPLNYKQLNDMFHNIYMAYITL